MSTPDVRVRLSPEGLAEVLAAFRKIERASAATGQKGHAGFLRFNSILGGTQALLAQVGLALSIGAFVNFIRNSARAADEIGRVGANVGAAAEKISALNYLAGQTDTNLAEVSQSLTILNRNLGELEAGEPGARKLFRSIGLSVRDFKGKDSAESLEVVAQALQRVQSQGGRTVAQLSLLGRSSGNMTQLLDDLAEKGLAKVIQRGKELGVVLDQDIINKIKSANDDMDLVQKQVQGLGAAFAAGFFPNLAQSLQMVSGKLEGQAEAWETFGAGVGAVLKFLVALVATTFDQVGTSLGTLSVRIVGLVKGFGHLVKGETRAAGQAFIEANAFADEEQRKLAERTRNRWKMVFTPAPAASAGGSRPTDRDRDPAETAAILARERLSAATAAADAEAKIAEARAKARQATDRRAFDEGLLSVRSYYARRRKAIEEETAREIDILQKRRAEAAAMEDPARAAEAVKKVDSEIMALRINQDTALFESLLEERKAITDLGQARIEIERTILSAQGQRHELAIRDMNLELERYEKILEQQGVGALERAAELARLKTALEASIRSDDAMAAAQKGLDDLGAAREKIERQVRAGKLTEFQAEQEILRVERERLAVLTQLALAALAAARATGDPERIRQAEELVAALGDVGVATQSATQSLHRLSEVAREVGFDALVDFFARGVDKANGFRDALNQVVGALRQVAAQAFASGIFSALGIKVPGKARGGPVGRRSGGGRVVGPGTPTSDSVLFPVLGGGTVALSRDEFVVRAAAATQPGADRFLKDFNAVGMSLFDGSTGRRLISPADFTRGLAGGGAIASQIQPAASRDGRLMVGIDHDPLKLLILQVLESPEGQRVQVQNAGLNRRALRGATEE